MQKARAPARNSRGRLGSAPTLCLFRVTYLLHVTSISLWYGETKRGLRSESGHARTPLLTIACRSAIPRAAKSFPEAGTRHRPGGATPPPIPTATHPSSLSVPACSPASGNCPSQHRRTGPCPGRLVPSHPRLTNTVDDACSNHC
jgi:hypothetical protein